MKIRKHQVGMISFIIEQFRGKGTGCFLNAIMGSGKTFTTWRAIYDLWANDEIQNVLLVVPVGILHDFKQELFRMLSEDDEDFDIDHIVQIFHGPGRSMNSDIPFTITTMGTLQSEWKKKNGVKTKSRIKIQGGQTEEEQEMELESETSDSETSNTDTDTDEHILDTRWDVVVFDEAHQRGNLETANVLDHVRKYRLVIDAIQRKFTIGLSGTPYTNNVTNIKSMLCLLQLLEKGVTYTIPALQALFSKHSYRVGEKDVEIQVRVSFNYQRKHLEMEDDVKRQKRDGKYNEMVSVLMQIHALQASGQSTAALQGNLHSLRSELQLMELTGVSTKKQVEEMSITDAKRCPKIAYILQYISRHPDKKIIVTSFFVCVLRLISRVISNFVISSNVFLLTGDMSLKEREVVKQKYRLANGGAILLLSKEAGGVGLSLTGNTIIITEPSPHFSKDKQVMHRVRQGQVDVIFLVTMGGLDESTRLAQIRKLYEASQFVKDELDIVPLVFSEGEIKLAKEKREKYKNDENDDACTKKRKLEDVESDCVSDRKTVSEAASSMLKLMRSAASTSSTSSILLQGCKIVNGLESCRMTVEMLQTHRIGFILNQCRSWIGSLKCETNDQIKLQTHITDMSKKLLIDWKNMYDRSCKKVKQ
jgi:superfamily II DNA or RNA helicase